MTINIFTPWIGLEIHAQLKTESKLFCSCSTESAYIINAPPNSFICPICAGHPGALPMAVNRKAVTLATRLAIACNCQIHLESKFDRKNYFYPDLPKGYQITQIYNPLATGGSLEFSLGSEIRIVRIRRVHIEEDAGKSKHEKDYWLVDLNRSGIPLVEIVTEPDIHSSKEAVGFLKEIQRILRYLDVSEASMELGNLRCDINISVHPINSKEIGSKTELKNLNSFHFVEDAINWEINRQINQYVEGSVINRQYTFHWDEIQKKGYRSRDKETESEYRYIWEPDQMSIILDNELLNEAKKYIPEMPLDRQRRFMSNYGFLEHEVKSLLEDRAIANYFESVLSKFTGSPKQVLNWINNQVMRELNRNHLYKSIDDLPITPDYLAELLSMVDQKRLNTQMAIKVFNLVIQTGQSPSEIVHCRNLTIMSEAAIIEIIQSIIEEKTELLERIRSGKASAVNAIIGMVIQRSNGLANGSLVRQLLSKCLEERGLPFK